MDLAAKEVLKRKVSILVDCDVETAFEFISSSSELTTWLKKSGPVPGAVSVQNMDGTYDFVGAKRHITFTSGDVSQEELLTFNPPGNYLYRLTEFGGVFDKLTAAAYGECWFDHVEGKTRITWEYSFTYKSIFARMILSIFLSTAYKKFMLNCLENAKNMLEKRKTIELQES